MVGGREALAIVARYARYMPAARREALALTLEMSLAYACALGKALVRTPPQNRAEHNPVTPQPMAGGINRGIRAIRPQRCFAPPRTRPQGASDGRAAQSDRRQGRGGVSLSVFVEVVVTRAVAQKGAQTGVFLLLETKLW